ncbi:MAG: hypothetical protein RRY29_04880 [Desulfovibrionaceae bacterium]
MNTIKHTRHSTQHSLWGEQPVYVSVMLSPWREHIVYTLPPIPV